MKRINVTSCNHNNSTGATLTDQWSRARASNRNRETKECHRRIVLLPIINTDRQAEKWTQKTRTHTRRSVASAGPARAVWKYEWKMHPTATPLTSKRWNCVNTKNIPSGTGFASFACRLVQNTRLFRIVLLRYRFNSRLNDQRSPRKQRAHTLSRASEFDVRSRAGTFHKNEIKIQSESNTNTSACAHAKSGNAVSLHRRRRRRRRFDSSTIYVRVFFSFHVSFHLNFVYFSGSWCDRLIDRNDNHKTQDNCYLTAHTSEKKREEDKGNAKQCETLRRKLHVRWDGESALRKLTHTIEQNALIHDQITRILRAYEIIVVVSRISA